MFQSEHTKTFELENPSANKNSTAEEDDPKNSLIIIHIIQIYHHINTIHHQLDKGERLTEEFELNSLNKIRNICEILI